MKRNFDKEIALPFPASSHEYIWGRHKTFQGIEDDMGKLLSHENILEDPWDESKVPAPNPWKTFTSNDLTSQDVQRMQSLLRKGFITTSFELCDLTSPNSRSILQGFVPKTQFSLFQKMAKKHNLYVWLIDFKFGPKTGSRAHGLYRFPNSLPPDHMLADGRRVWLDKVAGTSFNFGAFYLYSGATGAVKELTPSSQKVIAQHAYFAVVIPEKCVDVMTLVAQAL